MDVSFTSHMEEELDEIEEGRRDWRQTLSGFYDQFSSDLERARERMQSVKQAAPDSETACDKCGKPMVVQFSRKGDKFLGCSGFPECRNTKSIAGPQSNNGIATEFQCDKCGAPMLQRKGKRGRPYLACSAFPKCRNIMGLDKDGKPVKLEPRLSTAMSCPRCGADLHLQDGDDVAELTCVRCRTAVPLLSVQEALEKTEADEAEPLAVCEKCGKPMAIKRSRKGLFLGCTGYPDCKSTVPVPKERLPAPQPTAERCEKCGRPLVMRWGKYGRFLSCSGFPRCRNAWQISGRRRKCPAENCEGRLIKKIGKDGVPYMGCTRYPQCGHTEAVKTRKNDK
jgi:DNA topoisomerase-1